MTKRLAVTSRVKTSHLRLIHDAGVHRGYHFDENKIGCGSAGKPLLVTRGQLEYEWSHLISKMKKRAPSWLAQIETVQQPEAHPLFQVIASDIAEWEVVAVQADNR